MMATSRIVTVSALQFACTDCISTDVAAAERLVRVAHQKGANIILFQELSEGHYFCQAQREEYFHRAKPRKEHPTILRMQILAKELGVVIPVSFFEESNNAHYNSIVVIDADGTDLGLYRKSHIPDVLGYQEKFYFNPGDTGFKVFETKYAKIGVGICWDQWFPEAARAMVLQGAEILFYPTAIGSEPQDDGLDSRDHWKRVMQGHAGANVVPLVASNRIGKEIIETEHGKSEISFYGNSFIAGPTGELIAHADDKNEAVLIAQFDLDKIKSKRCSWGVFCDRHPDLYKEFDKSRVSRSFAFPAATYGTPKADTLSSSHLLSELELSCCNLDKSIGELRSDLSSNRGESESKLKSLESHIQEVHRCVQILIDKQVLADTQKELAKLQKDPSSSGAQIEESSSGPKKGTEASSDRHNHQQQQHVAPPQPPLPQQPTMEPPQPSSIPSQPQMTANQTPQYLPPTQTPQVNQQGPQQPGQSMSAYQKWPAQNGPVVSKSIFFWELITNSIHALEKVKADKSNLDHETKLDIYVDLNKTYKTMSIIDNGIGMTKAVLEKELCTKDGTCGVLHSAFLAAEKVLVTTKHNEDEQYVCEASRGDHCFKIDRDDSETSSLGRGTKITLFLEDDHLEFLDECRLEDLVDKHFKYIDYRITIRNYDSSNKYQSGIVHFSSSNPQLSGWYRVRPFISILENYLSKHFPDEVDAQKKQNEKKSSKEEVSFEEKKKELEGLRKVMAEVLRKKVHKVVVMESCDFPQMACNVSVDPKTKTTTMEINPWETTGIVDKLAELAAEDSDKYEKVLKKMTLRLFAQASVTQGYP